jgi:superfamily I DNA/RNA helicase
MNLSPEQRASVTTESRKALVLAGAGSGKTRVLIGRIAHLVENCQASPSEILALTFTRKAAGEMRERLHQRLGPSAYGATMGTMHAVALAQIKRFCEYLGLRRGITVYSEWEESVLLKDAARELGLWNGKNWKGVKAGQVKDCFNAYYAKGEEPGDMDPCAGMFRHFITRCRENNALTYGGLLTGFRLLLRQLQTSWLGWKHLLVDEAQDLDPLQWALVNDLAGHCMASLFVVGDVSQCQPLDTLVDTPSGPRMIGLLKDGDEVRAWCRHSQITSKVRRVKTWKRDYVGDLYHVTVGDKTTRATPGHKFVVRWANKSTEQYAVYIMYREDLGYRIGWCQVFCKSGWFHAGGRARIERADKLWILDVFKTKEQASAAESVLSVKYQIPTVTFEPPRNTVLYTADIIKLIFSETREVCRAEECLRDLGRNPDYPIWPRPEHAGFHRVGGKSMLFVCTASNLIPGLMSVPMPGREEWGRITSVSQEAYSGVVCSLDVEEDHNYIADGIVTLNSIYEWRGAVPEYLVEHAGEFDLFRLEDNYRSHPAVVQAANRLIEHNSLRLPLEMKPKRDGKPYETAYGVFDGGVSVQHELDSKELAGAVHIMEDHGRIAILARTHVLLQALSRELDAREVPHLYVGQKAALTNSEPFRRFHAFLKLLVNPHDNFAFMLARELFGISDEQYADIRATAAAQGQSHLQAWITWHISDNLLQRLYMRDAQGWREPRIASFIWELRDTLTIESRQSEDMAPAADFIRAWAEKAGPNATVQDYLDWLATYDIQDELDGQDPDRLTLCTVHAAKGLEWPVVIVAGVNEGILPGKQSLTDPRELEAERRLAYVAWTRARDLLVLAVRPETTTKPAAEEGQPPRVYHNPVSRFVAESGLPVPHAEG